MTDTDSTFATLQRLELEAQVVEAHRPAARAQMCAVLPHWSHPATGEASLVAAQVHTPHHAPTTAPAASGGA